jgi:hypothetical protein
MVARGTLPAAPSSGDNSIIATKWFGIHYGIFPLSRIFYLFKLDIPYICIL